MKHVLIFIVLLGSLNFAKAQEAVDKVEVASKEIVQHFKDMLDKAKFDNPKKEKACEAYPILKRFNTQDLVPQQKDVYNYLTSLTGGYEKSLNDLDAPLVNDGVGNTKVNPKKVLSEAKTFNKFVEGLTGKKVKDLSKKDKAILRAYYSYHPLKNETPMISKPKKFAVFEGCFAATIHTLTPSNWNHPNLRWDFVTTVTISCDCEENGEGTLNEAKFKFETAMKGVVDTDQISFNKVIGPGPVQPTVTLISSSCCPFEDPKGDASMQLDPNENISLPSQLLGINAGVGFGQDFEELSFCVGGEFLVEVTELGESPLFLGGNVQAETSSFMDTTAFTISAGPTAQLFTSITPPGNVHMTNGINGNYVIGSTDNNGFKTDVSGFTVSVNTGLNIQLSEDLFLSLIIPIVSHQNLSFEAEGGGTPFELKETTVFLNKNNPVKLGVRFGL